MDYKPIFKTKLDLKSSRPLLIKISNRFYTKTKVINLNLIKKYSTLFSEILNIHNINCQLNIDHILFNPNIKF